MKTLALVLSLALLLPAVPAPAAGPVVKMAWTMDGKDWHHRDASLTAYCLEASDLEVSVKCSYNGDLDSYIWAFKAAIPAGYEGKPWVLVGQDKGAVALLKFTPQNGAVAPLAWVPFAAPDVKQAWGSGGAANFKTPSVDAGLVLRWELLKNGAVLSTKQKVDDGAIRTKTTYQLRGVLAGTPKPHYLYSDAVELTPDTEVSA